MNKLFLLLIGVAIVGGAAMAGLFAPPKERSNAPAASASCVDFDPPSTTDTVTLSTGQTYGLIKDNAEIREEYKFGEMTQLLNEQVNGKNVYIMGSLNFYGKAINSDIIFVLQNTTPLQSPYVFKIYIRNGVPIPPE